MRLLESMCTGIGIDKGDFFAINAGCQVFLFFLFFPIFWTLFLFSYFLGYSSLFFPIYSYFLKSQKKIITFALDLFIFQIFVSTFMCLLSDCINQSFH